MWERITSDSLTVKKYRCRNIGRGAAQRFRVDSRHHGIFGFDQATYSKSNVLLVGAGGIGGECGEGCVRKGIGELHIFDGDTVDPTNLNRQHFTHRDLYLNKAVRLAKNLRDDGFLGTTVTGYPWYFQEHERKFDELKPDVVICGVDNDQTRVFVARFCVDRRIPAVFTAVSRDADQGYVFVQEVGGACFGCRFPEAIGNEITPCPGIPAIKDILKVVGGIVLFAVDTVLMNRRRNWNYRLIRLAGFVDSESSRIAADKQCRICQGKGAESVEAETTQPSRR